MSEYEEQTRGFKGTGRRAFTAEEDPREPSKVRDEVEEPLAASSADQAEFAEQIQARSVAYDERFFDLLSLLTTQASLHMGEPHPVTGASHEDLHPHKCCSPLSKCFKRKRRATLLGTNSRLSRTCSTNCERSSWRKRKGRNPRRYDLYLRFARKILPESITLSGASSVESSNR